MIELHHPNGDPVYIDGYYVAAIQQHNGVKVNGEDVPASMVYWTFPSARPDRAHVGMISIVRGLPREIATAFGFITPAEGTDAEA